ALVQRGAPRIVLVPNDDAAVRVELLEDRTVAGRVHPLPGPRVLCEGGDRGAHGRRVVEHARATLPIDAGGGTGQRANRGHALAVTELRSEPGVVRPGVRPAAER